MVDGRARERSELDVCALFRHQLRPLKSDLRDKVLLPILTISTDAFSSAANCKCVSKKARSIWRIKSKTSDRARHLPSYSRDGVGNLAEYKDEEFYGEFQSILTALEYLPRRTEIDPEKIAERAREKEIVKRRLERRCHEAPQVQRAIEKALAQINGRPGDPRSFDRLDELLNAQSYRLAFWRVAAEEINYRRFFDINDLAAIRMELPEVFDAAHQLVSTLFEVEP